MKKVLALAVVVAAPMVGNAQSSLTLYGIVGGGVRWTNNNNGGATVSYSNIVGPNRWGITGSEDLGGGIKAVFDLQSYFQTSTGALYASNVLFYGKAYVGLESKSFGRLTFGRQFSSLEDLAVATDPTHVGGDSAAITPWGLLVTNVFTRDTRVNNNIKYAYRTGNTLLSASYAPGGVAGSTRSGLNYSGQALYQSDTIMGGVAYQRTYNADATQLAQNYLVAGGWTAGPVTLYLSYLGLVQGLTSGTAPQRRDSVPAGGIQWRVTPAVFVTAAYYYDMARNLGNVQNASGHKKTAYLIAQYFLSKRTSIYAEFDHNTFTGAYQTDPFNLTVLNRNPTTTSATGITIGIQHNF